MRFFITLLAVMSLFSTAYAKEFRGIWVVTWEIFPKEMENKTPEKLKANIRSILDNVKKAGLNTVLWQVRQNGTTYYPSPLEPWGKWVNYQDPGFDPLAFAIEEAHKRELELHAWINTFESFDTYKGTPAEQHPEWICRDKWDRPMQEKRSLSPGLPAVRTYLINVVSHLAKNYQVDGIHMDYIRWNEYKIPPVDQDVWRGDYIFDSHNTFARGIPKGATDWDSWRRESLNIFAKRLSSEIKRLRPEITLSMAAIGKYNWGAWNGYHSVYQDAAKWLAEGWVDHIMGMNYSWRNYTDMTDGLNLWNEHLITGLNRGGRYSAGIGSLMLRNRDQWNNHIEVVQALRDISWVSGMQFFSYGDWLKMDFFSTAKELFFSDEALDTP